MARRYCGRVTAEAEWSGSLSPSMMEKRYNVRISVSDGRTRGPSIPTVLRDVWVARQDSVKKEVDLACVGAIRELVQEGVVIPPRECPHCSGTGTVGDCVELSELVKKHGRFVDGVVILSTKK